MISGLTTGLLSINEQSRLQTVWSPRQISSTVLDRGHNFTDCIGRGRSLDLRAPGTSVVTNGNSTESNLIRVGEASTKWKAASTADSVSSQPLKMDSIKGSARDSIKVSAKDIDLKSSSAGLSLVEEVDLVEKYLKLEV